MHPVELSLWIPWLLTLITEQVLTARPCTADHVLHPPGLRPRCPFNAIQVEIRFSITPFCTIYNISQHSLFFVISDCVLLRPKYIGATAQPHLSLDTIQTTRVRLSS